MQPVRGITPHDSQVRPRFGGARCHFGLLAARSEPGRDTYSRWCRCHPRCRYDKVKQTLPPSSTVPCVVLFTKCTGGTRPSWTVSGETCGREYLFGVGPRSRQPAVRTPWPTWPERRNVRKRGRSWPRAGAIYPRVPPAASTSARMPVRIPSGRRFQALITRAKSAGISGPDGVSGGHGTPVGTSGIGVCPNSLSGWVFAASGFRTVDPVVAGSSPVVLADFTSRKCFQIGHLRLVR